MLGRGPDGRSLRLRIRSTRFDSEQFSRAPSYIELPPKHLLPYLGTLSGTVKKECHMYDMSHSTPCVWHVPRLVNLPELYTDLYTRTKSPYGALRFSDCEPAVCLICGVVVAAGQHRPDGMSRQPGACTVHAYGCSGGTGIFFLVQKCTVLLIRDGKAACWSSLYLDEYGEEDENVRRGRPMFLNQNKYKALKIMYVQHRVAQEVTSIRSHADRVISENFY